MAERVAAIDATQLILINERNAGITWISVNMLVSICLI